MFLCCSLFLNILADAKILLRRLSSSNSIRIGPGLLFVLDLSRRTNFGLIFSWFINLKISLTFISSSFSFVSMFSFVDSETP